MRYVGQAGGLAAILGIFLFLQPVALRAAADLVLLDESTPPSAYRETLLLQHAVIDKTLPPIEQRVPMEPAVFDPTDPAKLGRQGGTWRMLVGREKDVRLAVVYGYARLVGYDADLQLRPDILKGVEVEKERIFTFRLRRGHRWSDGAPFTTEDFRYYWEDVANDPELSPVGPPPQMLVDGKPPKVEVLDEVTIRYSWDKPNPFFLPALAQASPLFIYRPYHYLKKYHIKYADPDELQKHVEESGARNWAQLHNRADNLYRFDNPALPTLQPWYNSTEPPSTRFLLRRNPYFHRVDARGYQLPYLDGISMVVTSGDLVPVKTGAGDIDLQARGLRFDDYTFLKQSEERGNYEVRLWKTVRGSDYALYPNLNTKDEAWQQVFRDARYRRALSLAVNRHELNQVIYFGLGDPGNQSALPGSPLHSPENRQAWAAFDLDKANALLDEMGLTERNGHGTRLLPDGRPMELVVETAGESTLESDLLELIGDSWGQIGIKVFTRPMQREVLRNRIFAGETLMTLWYGYENAMLGPEMSPEEFVPVHQYSYHWPMWGQYFETQGNSGVPVDTEVGERLMALYRAWLEADTLTAKRAAWEEILQIHADHVFTIGLVARVPQPVVVGHKMHNVPGDAIYNWDPGAHFGIYRTDTFWMDR